jgi:hypothetical protein
MVDVPINLGSVDARLYVERGVVEFYVDVVVLVSGCFIRNKKVGRLRS